MGNAATDHLARRGYEVVELERYDVPHSRGSSHGVTRIIRLPLYEDPAYVPLVRRAFDLWAELDGDRPVGCSTASAASTSDRPTVRASTWGRSAPARRTTSTTRT
jgi:glycine/D-amino acid oxidase-like deaminating enzyme